MFPWPYLDRAGFTLRSAMPATDVALVATLRPGYIESQIARWQSYFEGRFRKRYARSLPFGSVLRDLNATGTSPPVVTLSGTPQIGSMRVVLQITTAGPDGAAAFKWSLDNGVNFAGSVTALQLTAGGSGYVTAPPVTLDAPPAGGAQATATAMVVDGVVTAVTLTSAGTGYVAPPGVTFGPPPIGGTLPAALATGLTAIPLAVPTFSDPIVPVQLQGSGLAANFPAGTYALDNCFQAATPVPEAILQWLTIVVTPDVYRARGTNPQDPELERLEKDRERVIGTDGKGGELREAADGESGLFDLPVDDALGSAIGNGPLAYSETSPYVAFDREECIGRGEDRNGGGSYP